MSSESTERIGYLGPVGTFSYHAVKRFYSKMEGVAYASIRQVFEALAEKSVDQALVPFENILQGPVAETLDLLLEYNSDIEISDSNILRVEHALGSFTTTKVEEVQRIYSHTQPLEQCRRVLMQKYPSAQLLPAQSSSAALDYVKNSGQAGDAFIANIDALKSAGAYVLEDRILGDTPNFTRFVLLMRRGDKPAEMGKSRQSATAFVLHPHKDRKGLLHEILTIISITHGINLLTLHSRPDAAGGLIFFFEIEGGQTNQAVKACLIDLDRYCEETTTNVAELVVFGSYSRERFEASPFKNIALVGGKGRMGRWLERFFDNCGVSTTIYDVDSKKSFRESCKGADVIFLSVPMGTIPSLLPDIAEITATDPKKLIVENCSIKVPLLETIVNALPQGVEVLGLHTMFGDNTISLRGQNVAVIRTARSGELANKLIELFYNQGANLTEIQAEEHDKLGAILQSVVQFSLLGLGKALVNSNEDLTSAARLSTPNSRVLIEALCRVIDQSPELTSDLQTINRFASHARAVFKEALDEIDSLLASGDTSAVSQTLETLKKKLKASRT